MRLPPLPGTFSPTVSSLAFLLPDDDQQGVNAELPGERDNLSTVATQRAIRLKGGDEALDPCGIRWSEAEVMNRRLSGADLWCRPTTTSARVAVRQEKRRHERRR